MPSCVVQIRVNEKIKQKVDELFDDLGLDTPTAIRIFLAQALKCQGFPFDVRRPAYNAQTLNAISEIEEHIKNQNGQTFESVDALFEDLEK